jgi:hypothetical protein
MVLEYKDGQWFMNHMGYTYLTTLNYNKVSDGKFVRAVKAVLSSRAAPYRASYHLKGRPRYWRGEIRHGPHYPSWNEHTIMAELVEKYNNDKNAYASNVYVQFGFVLVSNNNKTTYNLKLHTTVLDEKEEYWTETHTEHDMTSAQHETLKLLVRNVRNLNEADGYGALNLMGFVPYVGSVTFKGAMLQSV